MPKLGGYPEEYKSGTPAQAARIGHSIERAAFGLSGVEFAGL